MNDVAFDLILASGSPRRRELLALTGWSFHTVQVNVPESRNQGEDPTQMALRLARAKADTACALKQYDGMLLTADTLVVDGDHILGKPRDREHAREILNRLKNKEHQVITAIVLQPTSNEWSDVDVCMTMVPMRDYSQQELEDYLCSQSPMDKAGAYGIQDQFFHPVSTTRMYGCYANVMGLPLCHVARGIHKRTRAAVRHIPQACMQFTGYTCPVYPDILEGRM